MSDLTIRQSDDRIEKAFGKTDDAFGLTFFTVSRSNASGSNQPPSSLIAAHDTATSTRPCFWYGTSNKLNWEL